MSEYLRESLIFSRQFKEEDIIRLLNFEKDRPDDFLIDYDIEEDKKISINNFVDLKEKMESLFIKDEIILINNDIKAILEYYYCKELIIEEFISAKYINNNNKRYTYLRIADYVLRILFEDVIPMIQEIAKTINKYISEINLSYFEKNNIDDLSDKGYRDKLNQVLGTKKIPHFLLREGYRIRRKIQENRDIFINNIYNENYIGHEIDDNSIDFSEIDDNDNFSDDENENYSINNIIKEIKNIKTPFSRECNEVYISLFFMFIKEMNNNEIYDEIKKNINKFIKYFQIETYKEFEQFRQNYIDINPNKIPHELISDELSSINKSSYTSKYILASYKVLIDQIFKDPNYIYINLLLFLQNYISNENKVLKNIIEKELDSILSSNDNNLKNNKKNFDEQVKYTNNYNKYAFYQQKRKIHSTKKLNLSSLRNIFNNENDYLKNRFNEIIKDEQAHEKGSNILKFSIINFFKNLFNMKETENEETIEKQLKLIPYKEGNFEEKTILILVSGYFSSKSNHFEDWEKLIKIYKKRFYNPIIYFFNWPSSRKNLLNFILHRKDFRDTRERGKYCGRILALVLMSNQIFNNFKINLAAFSLGNHVIKHCIKELERFGRLDLLNNIVFMAGATDINCNFKWEHRLGAISGKIINCYSDFDLALWYCKNITGKDTIGSKKLKIRNVTIKNYLVSCFHILYRDNMDKIWEIFIDDLKE